MPGWAGPGGESGNKRLSSWSFLAHGAVDRQGDGTVLVLAEAKLRGAAGPPGRGTGLYLGRQEHPWRK